MPKCNNCNDTGLKEVDPGNYPYTQEPCGFCAVVFSGKEMEVLINILGCFNNTLYTYEQDVKKPSDWSEEEWKTFMEKFE